MDRSRSVYTGRRLCVTDKGRRVLYCKRRLGRVEMTLIREKDVTGEREESHVGE